MSKQRGLPQQKRMRHDSHFVEEITAQRSESIELTRWSYHDMHVMTVPQQSRSQMTTDEASGPGHQHSTTGRALGLAHAPP